MLGPQKAAKDLQFILQISFYFSSNAFPFRLTVVNNVAPFLFRYKFIDRTREVRKMRRR